MSGGLWCNIALVLGNKGYLNVLLGFIKMGGFCFSGFDKMCFRFIKILFLKNAWGNLRFIFVPVVLLKCFVRFNKMIFCFIKWFVLGGFRQQIIASASLGAARPEGRVQGGC